MTRLYQPWLQKYNLTYPQYIVMLVLFEYKTIDFKALSEKIDLRTGTLTPILQKLEEIGYLDRKPNPKDSRRKNIVLTKKGTQLQKDVVEVPIKLAGKLRELRDTYQGIITDLDNLKDVLDHAIAKQD
jgi:DNA-binding MarR family transcriptional regulator